MSEQGIAPELEKQAIALQTQLKEFAAADFASREKMLPELFKLIKSNGTQDCLKTLSSASELNEQLKAAAEKTAATPVKTAKGEEKIWTGEYSLVALKENGTIAGFVSTGVPQSYLEWESTDPDALKDSFHFNDLVPAALTKAVFALHGAKAVKEGHGNLAGGITLETIERSDRLKLGYGFHGGATGNEVKVGVQAYYKDLDTNKPIEKHPITTIYIGASGCPLTQEYNGSLLDVGGKAGPFTNAGNGDYEFGGLAGANIEEPNLPIVAAPEPVFARQAKRVGN